VGLKLARLYSLRGVGSALEAGSLGMAIFGAAVEGNFLFEKILPNRVC
jgi:hypothetical protein